MIESDTTITVKVKSWQEMVASADYVSERGLHYGTFIFKKDLLANFINDKELTINMTSFQIWEATKYPNKNGAPCLVLLGLLCTKEEESKAENKLKEIINKFNRKEGEYNGR